MTGFILRILGNSIAVYLAFWLVPGFLVTGGWVQYLIAGLVLAILNMTLRPILKLVSFPIIMLSLGLFTLVINALMLWLLDYFLIFITIQDLVALVWATIVVTIVNLIVSIFSKAF
ncbi:MAG: hypothetical protein A2941_00095 [Candidatus Yanofskybacteria bacterium RIFCSPLOWO2_01_FULL_49_17]|uniref:Phage holin family protein n=1 Tax=Candidatus Yanofskybacteria bacterium RIFCSPLOWO2_01_FULL_49_17 TaxID=1802700 RepID=A0A1F8GR27_9BACT|nr:MAG: hypothetical protein A2941_00095 [Candidatus Yanofskybacteria bacterium RIFCSPLOWO2_01_FULL_49_17]